LHRVVTFQSRFIGGLLDLALPESWRFALERANIEPFIDSKTLVKGLTLKPDHARQVLRRMRIAGLIEPMQGARRGIYRLVTEDRKRFGGLSLDDFVPGLPYHEGPYCFWWVGVPRDWVGRLSASVILARTGLKQVGFKQFGDPCSAQFERNGTVRVYPGKGVPERVWREWLQRELVRRGWGMDEAKAFDLQLRHSIRQIEIVGAQVPDSVAKVVPHMLSVPDAGLTFRVCDTPKPNSFEASIDLRKLSGFLGIDKIHEVLDRFIVAQDLHARNLETHVAVVKEMRKESLTWRSVGENIIPLISKLEGGWENTVRMISKLENLLEALTERLNGLNDSKAPI